jgi:hypothetical protein
MACEDYLGPKRRAITPNYHDYDCTFVANAVELARLGTARPAVNWFIRINYSCRRSRRRIPLRYVARIITVHCYGDTCLHMIPINLPAQRARLALRLISRWRIHAEISRWRILAEIALYAPCLSRSPGRIEPGLALFAWRASAVFI